MTTDDKLAKDALIGELIDALRDRFPTLIGSPKYDAQFSVLHQNARDNSSRIDHLGLRIEGFSRSIDKLEAELEDVHKFIYRVQLGISSDERCTRYIPVRVYISDYDQSNADFGYLPEALSAVHLLLGNLGFAQVGAMTETKGSWFGRAIFRSKEALSSKEVQDALQKAKHGFELAQIEHRQAEVNQRHAESLKNVVQSLESTTYAAIQIGSLLLVKTVRDGRAVIITKTLSVRELIHIENNNHILSNPDLIFESLSSLNQEIRGNSIELVAEKPNASE